MLDINDHEVRRAAHVHVTQVKEVADATGQLMTHFSSWMKLKRAIAWFLKLKHSLKKLIKERDPGGERRTSHLRECLKGISLTFGKS